MQRAELELALDFLLETWRSIELLLGFLLLMVGRCPRVREQGLMELDVLSCCKSNRTRDR